MTETKKADPADRWRYIVLLAKFGYHALHDDGIPKSLSVLIPSLVFQLDLDYTTVGFLISLEFGVVYLACPISNFLSRIFNPRVVATTGGILAGISLMLAYFCQSALTLGCSLFCTGLFTSPLRQVSGVTLHRHFGEKFGLAETVTNMGGQLGGILFPYITVLCHEDYGLRGTLLILGSFALHEALIGATMITPQGLMEKDQDAQTSNIHDRKKSINRDFSMYGDNGIQTHCAEPLLQCPEEMVSRQSAEMKHNSSRTRTDKGHICSGNRERHNSSVGDSSKVSACSLKALNMDLTPRTSKWKAVLKEVSSFLDMKSLKNEPIFVLLFLPCQCLFEICYVSWSLFSFSYGVSVGLPEHTAVYLAMAGSLGGLLGRTILLVVLYKSPRLSPHLFALNAGLASAALVAYPFSSSPVYLVFCSALAGSGFYAGYSSYFAALSVKVEAKNFAGALSYAFLLGGIGITMSGSLTGFMYEIFQSFPVIFRALGASMCAIAIAFSLFICLESRFAPKGERMNIKI